MKLLLTLSLLFISTMGFSQKLKFKISNFDTDTTIHLVRYFGKGLYYADTAQIKDGYVEFDGNRLKPGIIGLFFPDQKMLEFLYNKEDVMIEASYPNLLTSAKVKKSEENKIFIEYVNYMGRERQKANVLVEKRKSASPDSDTFKQLSDQIAETTKKVVQRQEQIVAEHDGMLVSKIVKMSMDIEIPEAPTDEAGNVIDSGFRFNYYRDHYWDNVDLSDDRLVRTPIFHNKLSEYFSKRMMLQHWDTVLYYAYDFVDRLDEKSEMYQYTVSWIASTYEQSKIMGMDKVFVRMAEKYYCALNEEGKPKAFWMLDSEEKREKLEKLCEKAETQSVMVMGVKPPNIRLVDTTDVNWHDFYSIDAEYTILYFWDPECGHCKKITPKLQTLYEKKFKERNVEIFAVGKAVGEDFEKWKAFIKKNHLEFINVGVTERLYKAALEDARQFVPKYTTLESLNYQKTYDIYSTPRVFVLDKDKKIVAKSLSVAQLEDMIDRLQGHKDLEKIFKLEEEDPEDSQMH